MFADIQLTRDMNFGVTTKYQQPTDINDTTKQDTTNTQLKFHLINITFTVQHLCNYLGNAIR